METSRKFGLNNRQLHAGQVPDPTTGSRAGPIYQTSSYVFKDTAHAARMDRHVQNAQTVAEHLEKHPHVKWVSYPGLKCHPDYLAAQKYLPKGPGAILGFGVEGGLEAGRNFIEDILWDLDQALN